MLRSVAVVGSNGELGHERNYTIAGMGELVPAKTRVGPAPRTSRGPARSREDPSAKADSDWQKPPKCKTCQVHAEAEKNSLAEAQAVGRNGIQQNTFKHPNQELDNKQSNEIVPEEKAQRNPQKSLSNQVCENTREQNGSDRLPAPKGIAKPDRAFHEDCDRQSVDHFLLMLGTPYAISLFKSSTIPAE